MVPDGIQQKRILSLLLVMCIIYISVPLSVEHIKRITPDEIEHAIIAPVNEINNDGIVIQVFECVGIVRIFGILDAFVILEPGTYIPQEFNNIVRKKKRRPQMARQNLNEETEHLF